MHHNGIADDVVRGAAYDAAHGAEHGGARTLHTAYPMRWKTDLTIGRGAQYMVKVCTPLMASMAAWGPWRYPMRAPASP